MDTLLEVENITKYYPGVTALNQVSFNVKKGEIHALMGENGAGKSTLVKVISGAIQPDGGIIRHGGVSYTAMTPALSQNLGIGVIYQEFNLIDSLSVVENVCLGERIGGKVMPDFKEMRERAISLFRDLGVDIPVDHMVSSLSVAERQIVEIAKAINRDAKLLIMDEPSAAIAQAEVENLFKIVTDLRERGVTVIYISHRIEEVFRIADRITILRDGQFIETCDAKKIDRKYLITSMVGRELDDTYPVRSTVPGEVILEARDVHGNGDYGINFELRKGEVLGIAGLVGSGRTELAKLLFGAEKLDRGELRLRGRSFKVKNPREAIAHGICLIPEYRKEEGGFQEHTIRWNTSIMSLRAISKYSVVSKRREKGLSAKYFKLLSIRAPSDSQLLKNLSGGNQQKVVLAKALAAQTEIILFDEPTRGIDVGAKHEIYRLINQLVADGVSILMISSEMEELIGMCDRILVMHERTIAGVVERHEFSQQHIMELASGTH